MSGLMNTALCLYKLEHLGRGLVVRLACGRILIEFPLCILANQPLSDLSCYNSLLRDLDHWRGCIGHRWRRRIAYSGRG